MYLDLTDLLKLVAARLCVLGGCFAAWCLALGVVGLAIVGARALLGSCP